MRLVSGYEEGVAMSFIFIRPTGCFKKYDLRLLLLLLFFNYIKTNN